MLKLKIRAETINSKVTQKDRKRIITDLLHKAPNTKLLYVTPEQVATNGFQVNLYSLLLKNKILYYITTCSISLTLFCMYQKVLLEKLTQYNKVFSYPINLTSISLMEIKATNKF